jgi:hypothetical protein
VFGRKYQIAVRKLEQWYVHEIKDIIETCVILHNMMVEERMDRDEPEDRSWYDYREDEEDEDNNNLDPAVEYVQRQEAEIDLHRRLQEEFYDGPAINVAGNNYKHERQLFDLRQEAVNRRWDTLHDTSEHFRLREAIVRELNNNTTQQQ